MKFFLKVLVLLTFLDLGFSEPIGEDCKVPENVGNLKHVLVECKGTYCQWINDFILQTYTVHRGVNLYDIP